MLLKNKVFIARSFIFSVGFCFLYMTEMPISVSTTMLNSIFSLSRAEDELQIFVNGSLDNSKDRAWVMEERRNLVAKFCQKRLAEGDWPSLETRFHVGNMAYVEKYNLTYCPIGKTGTGTWFARFVKPSKRKGHLIRSR